MTYPRSRSRSDRHNDLAYALVCGIVLVALGMCIVALLGGAL